MPGVIGRTALHAGRARRCPLPPQRYLAVYEISAPPAEIMQSFMGGLGAGTLTVSPALDLATMAMSFWAPHGSEVKGASA